MTVLTFAVGGILAATGMIASVVSVASSMIALIPATLGALTLIAVFISRGTKARRHALQVAPAIVLFGIASFARTRSYPATHDPASVSV